MRTLVKPQALEVVFGPKPPPEPETPPPVEDPLPPPPPIEDPEPSTAQRGRHARNLIVVATLFIGLSACQQAAPTPPADNQRPSVELVAEPDNGAAPLTLTLSAQGTDPDGDPLTYIWTIRGAGFETFEGKAVETRTLTDPGTYIVEVVVNDGQEDSEADSLEILVRGADEPEL